MHTAVEIGIFCYQIQGCGDFVPPPNALTRVANVCNCNKNKSLQTPVVENLHAKGKTAGSPPNKHFRNGLSFRRNLKSPRKVLKAAAKLRNTCPGQPAPALHAGMTSACALVCVPGLPTGLETREFSQPAATTSHLLASCADHKLPLRRWHAAKVDWMIPAQAGSGDKNGVTCTASKEDNVPMFAVCEEHRPPSLAFAEPLYLNTGKKESHPHTCLGPICNPVFTLFHSFPRARNWY